MGIMTNSNNNFKRLMFVTFCDSKKNKKKVQKKSTKKQRVHILMRNRLTGLLNYKQRRVIFSFEMNGKERKKEKNEE